MTNANDETLKQRIIDSEQPMNKYSSPAVMQKAQDVFNKKKNFVTSALKDEGPKGRKKSLPKAANYGKPKMPALFFHLIIRENGKF